MPFTLTVPADLTHSHDVRNHAKHFFAEAGVDRTWQNRLVLVVDELFMNAVKYGSHAGDMVELAFAIEGGRVEVAITDQNASDIDPETLLQKIHDNETELSENSVSGRGLALIAKEWTDALSVTKTEGKGLTLTFHKTI